MENLIVRNWLAFGAHLIVLAGVLIIFGITKPKVQLELFREGVPPPSQENAFNPKCDINQPLELKNVGSFNLQRALVAFFVITICAHLFQATDGFGSGQYTSMIADGWNWIRWLEYGLSASIMTFAIGSADGTRNFPSLLCLGLITIGMQMNGLSVEAILKKGSVMNDTAVVANTLSGWILFIALWFVILQNFFSIVQDVSTLQPNQPEFQVPVWLYFIGPLQFFWYATFGLVQGYQILDRFRGVTRPQVEYESWYIFLSFAAKISLAAGLAQGLAFRQINC